MMLSQRVRGGVIRIKNKLSNGPLRAQSKGADHMDSRQGSKAIKQSGTC